VTLYEFILWLLMTVIDVGGPHPLADARLALAYLKVRRATR
jgi:hypothetical protein